MSFKRVPLNHLWTGDTKLDLHAIYRRANGDTATLPLRRHHQWESKGLTYVTLADAESLSKAVPYLRAQGLNPQDFVCGIDGDGRPTCWNADLYLSEQQANRADADAELRAQIEKFGVEAVEAIRGSKIPAHLLPEPKPAAKAVKAGTAA
jgi:hypothetical protein